MELTGAEHLANVATFALDTVIPQFGLVGYRETSLINIGSRAGAWLLGLGEAPITVRFDCRADVVLLETVLSSAGFWTELRSVLNIATYITPHN